MTDIKELKAQAYDIVLAIHQTQQILASQQQALGAMNQQIAEAEKAEKEKPKEKGQAAGE